MMLKPEQLSYIRLRASSDVSRKTIIALLGHIEAQQARIADIEAQNARLLSLLADIRIACGDHGKRMQDELVAYISELEQDAARYRWLRDKMLGVDFDWNESGLTALCFEMPDGCAYGGNCDQNIDNAMQK